MPDSHGVFFNKIYEEQMDDMTTILFWIENGMVLGPDVGCTIHILV